MAIFPNSVATLLQLLEARNLKYTTLASDISSSATTIPLTNASVFPQSGYVTFADTNEIVYYDGISSNQLLNCVRGSDGSTASAHSAGVRVEQRMNAKYHNILAEEIRAIELYLQDNFGLTPNPLKWTKYTLSHTQFQASSTTKTITLFSLPPGGVIHGVKIKHSASFAGGAISNYTISVGLSGNVAKYASPFNVFQSPGSSVMQTSEVLISENQTAATDVTVTATSTGANLNASTSGLVDIWVLTSVTI